MAGNRPDDRFRVVIAGGGVAALEAALALRYLAGEVVRITMVSPREEFVYRPLTVREPFSGPSAHRYPLSRFASDLDVELLTETVASVDPEGLTVMTAGGDSLAYDALLLAPGARGKAIYDHALTLDDRKLDDQMHGLVQDVEGGAAKRVVFVIPPGRSWPLPAYELAIMTANQAYAMSLAAMVTVVTPEPAPLAVFGTAASQTVEQVLVKHRIVTLTSSTCSVSRHNQLLVHPQERKLDVDRIVALPELYGPSIPGVPADDDGFIPVDRHGAVPGVPRVFAAGDATDYPIKHGNIAAQQADAAAESIAARAGISLDPQPVRPVLHGVLLGAKPPIYLRARVENGRGVDSEASTEALWPATSKIEARYLAPYLSEVDSAPEAVSTEVEQ